MDKGILARRVELNKLPDLSSEDLDDLRKKLSDADFLHHLKVYFFYHEAAKLWLFFKRSSVSGVSGMQFIVIPNLDTLYLLLDRLNVTISVRRKRVLN